MVGVKEYPTRSHRKTASAFWLICSQCHLLHRTPSFGPHWGMVLDLTKVKPKRKGKERYWEGLSMTPVDQWLLLCVQILQSNVCLLQQGNRNQSQAPVWVAAGEDMKSLAWLPAPWLIIASPGDPWAQLHQSCGSLSLGPLGPPHLSLSPHLTSAFETVWKLTHPEGTEDAWVLLEFLV